MLSRRDTLRLAGFSLAALRTPAFPSRFWEWKDSSQWTLDEIRQLLTDSPWATAAIVRHASRRAPQFPAPSLWSELPKKPKPWKVTVRWESASPIQDALKATPNGDFKSYHVLNVVGDARITDSLRDNQLLPGRLQALGSYTTMEADTGPALFLEKIEEATHESRRAILFYFPRRRPIPPEAKHLWFATIIDGFEVLARFDPREMAYRGKLDL